MEKKPNWFAFFNELAFCLQGYKYNRQGLNEKLEEVLKTVVAKKSPRQRINIKSFTWDPFSIFSLFNKSDMCLKSRLNYAEALKLVFGLNSELPNNLKSVAVVCNQRPFFSENQNSKDIDYLWELFELALSYGSDKEIELRLADYFKLSIYIKGNAISKLSLGLFWVNPQKFLSLDSRTLSYLKGLSELPDNIKKRAAKSL